MLMAKPSDINDKTETKLCKIKPIAGRTKMIMIVVLVRFLFLGARHERQVVSNRANSMTSDVDD